MDMTCFVIGPIGDKGSDVRRHADWVLDGIINPALKAAGLPEGVRADRITIPGMIDSQVINDVLDAELVIADLTFKNPNVFYELGLRHREEKPIIHLVHKSEEKLPFDVAPFRTIFVSWDTPEDVRISIEQLREHVQAATSEEHEVENPVTRARGRQHLKETATPTEKVLLEEIQNLSARIAELEHRTTSENSGFFEILGHPPLTTTTNTISFHHFPPNPAAGRARGGIGGPSGGIGDTTGGIGGTADRPDKD
jgi:hypothetical protein